ncbi:MAG TPA: ATP-binding cassette domain-containing protein [Limnochordia bacterium]|nr:ATP-binding cassette domain-containing protein [Limnochordia bacterium]
MNSPVVMQGVAMRYRGAADPVFTGLDLTVAAGEWLFLIGPSGSGKTSILRLLYGAERPAAGEVRVFGELVRPERAYRFRRGMGLIFQNFELLPNRSALENVAYGGEALGWSPGEARARARARLEEVGLLEHRHRLPHELSGGEQQRVGIARALIHEPRLILADEPTGDLDLGTARQVFAILDALHKRWGATLIVSTHSRELLSWADGRVFDVGGLHQQAPKEAAQ